MQSFSELATFISENTNLRGHTPNHVCIIINRFTNSWDEEKERLTTITWHSLIKWRYKNKDGDFYTIKNNIIFSNTVEEAIRSASEYNFAFITSVGFTYTKEISECFDTFKLSGLLYKKDINLHTLFINLKQWREIGMPSISDLPPHKNCNDSFLSTHELQLRVSVERDYNNNVDWNILYLNNNERYITNKYTQLTKKFDVIYTHAGGAVAEFLWSEYGHRDTQLIIYDNHPATLEWKRKCYNIANSYDDIIALARIVAKKYASLIDECEYRNMLTNHNKRVFTNEMWVECFNRIKNVDFIDADIIKDDILSVDTNKTNLLYFSNIFAYPPNIHRSNILTIHNKFVYYTNLANVAVFGDNVFMDAIFTDNTGLIKTKDNLPNNINV